MNRADIDRFTDELEATMAYYEKPINADMTAMFFDDLADYPLEAVLAGLKLHRRNPERGQFAPKVADVEREVQAFLRRKWLSADEAWAKALIADDEAVTVIWTEEAQYAFGVCRPIMVDGDMVAARMAFKQAYERAVAKAVSEMRGPIAVPSLGHDPDGRKAAISEAVSAGLLTRDRTQALLPDAGIEITTEGKAIAGLLSGKSAPDSGMKGEFLQRLAEFKQAAKSTKTHQEIKAEMEAIKRLELEERRAKALAGLGAMA